MTIEAQTYMCYSKWSRSTVIKEDIAHYKRARARGPGVDSDFSIDCMRRSMGSHIHARIEQAIIAGRTKLAQRVNHQRFQMLIYRLLQHPKQGDSQSENGAG